MNNKMIPCCLVNMQKAHRTLFPTCWHIHILCPNCLSPPVHADTAVITLYIKHPTGMMTLWWVCTGQSPHYVSAFVISKSSKNAVITPGNARRLHSGLNSAGDGASPRGQLRCTYAAPSSHVSEDSLHLKVYHWIKWCNFLKQKLDGKWRLKLTKDNL